MTYDADVLIAGAGSAGCAAVVRLVQAGQMRSSSSATRSKPRPRQHDDRMVTGSCIKNRGRLIT